MQVDWDALEAAGHDFTLVSGPIAGRSTYLCERCSCLLIADSSGVVLLHPAPGTSSSLSACDRDPDAEDRVRLSENIDALRNADFARSTANPPLTWPKDPHCPRCRRTLDYFGEPHDDCPVREVMDS